MNNEYYWALKKRTEQLIVQDGVTIKSLLTMKTHNSIISLLLLPYVGLFCREAEEYYGINFVDSQVEKQLMDIRNAIKIFSEKYNKSEHSFLQVDSKQDDYFRRALKYSFTRKMNIHYNIGVYFDCDGHVIGDTQLINYYLDVVQNEAKVVEKRAYIIGKALGTAVSMVCTFGTQKTEQDICINDKRFIIGYIDYNSNRKNSPFKHRENKGLNLLLLHMLGTLGIYKYVISAIIGDNNQWGYRCEYIVYHNVWGGLGVLKRHFDYKKHHNIDLGVLSQIIDDGRRFFPSEYRNCMMHYGLIHHDSPCIKESEYNPEIPLYGLVESCFDGMSVHEYYKELREYMATVERFLNGWFVFDQNKIQWDL